MANNPKVPTLIDLTLDSDSESDCEIVYRHPLVTPRIARPLSVVSKRRAPTLIAPPPALSTGDDSGPASDSEDEVLLVTMLPSESPSDMDLGSSDVEFVEPKVLPCS